MNRKEEIRNLLEKYLEGQSSLKEEKQLRYYFLFEEVDQEFESYKVLFQFFESEKQLELSSIPSLKKEDDKPSQILLLRYWRVAVAAVLIIGLGLSWYSFYKSESTESLTNKEVLIAQKYLNLSLGTLDKNYVRSAELLNNAGKIEESTQKIKEVGEIYDTHQSQLIHLKYIDQSLNKLKKIKNIQKSRIKLVM